MARVATILRLMQFCVLGAILIELRDELARVLRDDHKVIQVEAVARGLQEVVHVSLTTSLKLNVTARRLWGH